MLLIRSKSFSAVSVNSNDLDNRNLSQDRQKLFTKLQMQLQLRSSIVTKQERSGHVQITRVLSLDSRTKA